MSQLDLFSPEHSEDSTGLVVLDDDLRFYADLLNTEFAPLSAEEASLNMSFFSQLVPETSVIAYNTFKATGRKQK